MLNQGLECLERLTDFRREFGSDEESVQSLSEFNKIGEIFSRRESFLGQDLVFLNDQLLQDDLIYSQSISNPTHQLQSQKQCIIQAFKLRKELFTVERKSKISKLSKKKSNKKLKNLQEFKSSPRINSVDHPELHIVIQIPKLKHSAKQQQNTKAMKMSQGNSQLTDIIGSDNEQLKEFESQVTNCSFQDLLNFQHFQTESF